MFTANWPFAPGLTARVIAEAVADRLPRSVPIDVARNGALLGDDDYDTPLADGDELILGAHTGGGAEIIGYLVQALIIALVSVAVNFALAALNPQPKVPDVPQERGDERSATYSWGGIQTNYGQGFIVPALYGVHGTGCQVISTEVFGISSNSRLNVLLAISEGPVHRIGDTIANGQDFLGTITTSPVSNGPVPGLIRVNDRLMSEGSTGVQAWAFERATSGGLPVPLVNFDDLNENDEIFAWRLVGSTYQQVTGTCRVVRISGTSQVPFIYFDSVPSAWQALLDGGTQLRLTNGASPTLASLFRMQVVDYSLETLQPETTGAWCFLREGSLLQEPMPWVFEGTSVNFAPNLDLLDFGDQAVFAYSSGDDVVRRVRVGIAAPVGLYQQTQQGGLEQVLVQFQVHWRFEGEQAWREFENGAAGMSITGESQSPASTSRVFYIDAGAAGSIEVRVRRVTGNGDTYTQSATVWSDVSFSTGYVLSYPRTALLGVSMESNARWSGGLPSFLVVCEGIKVRMWDPEEGWSDRTWDVPTEAPFDWCSYPPGRNPAWILLDFLLAPWGLGAYLTEDDLDLESFARWAVWCDRDPDPSTPWGEAQFTCDVVMDNARPAWEWVLTICACGRASPVFIDGKIGVVYEYRDAHSNGSSISVPAKSPLQLFTSSNTSDLTVTWLPRATRPTTFIYQFLNEQTDWRQDVFPVEDPEATFNDQTELFPDQYRPQQVQAFGQTRVSQLFRDAMYRHRVGRLITRRVDFKTGRWALAAQIGDLIEVESEVLRPFAGATAYDTADSYSGILFAGGDDVTQVTVDHLIESTSGAIVMRGPNGEPVHATWSSIDSTLTLGGRTCTILNLDDPVTVVSGTPCAWGEPDKIVEPYLIVATVLNNDLTIGVTALQWVEEVYDDVTLAEFVDAPAALSLTEGVTEEAGTPTEPKVRGNSIAIVANEEGTHTITFGRPVMRQLQPARVYVRLQSDGRWSHIGTTEGNSVTTPLLVPHRDYEVSVALESFDGDAPLAEQGVRVRRSAPEFTASAPQPVTGLACQSIDAGIRLTWNASHARNLVGYEVRAGSQWNGARQIYRGSDNSVLLSPPPLDSTLMVVAEVRSGMQSQPVAISACTWSPRCSKAFVDQDEIGTGLLGTHSGTQIDGTSSWLELEPGEWEGTYTSGELDAGFSAPFLWRVELDHHELSGVLVDDVTERLDSGEAAWRTVDGRPASTGSPGVDWSRSVDDFTGTVDSYAGEMVHGPIGSIGSHTQCLVESRYYDGSWSEWAAHVDGIRVASKAQFRVTLRVESLDYESQVHALRITANL